jgi:tetratricopeptide (TPR) repeat protein
MASKKRGRTEPPPPARSSARSTWLFAALIVAAGTWAYSNSFTGAFMGDDMQALVDNPGIKKLWPPIAPRDTTLAGRPISMLSFQLNYAFAPADVRDALRPRTRDSGPDPSDPHYANLWGYHAANLGIHLLAALALFGVVRRTLATPAFAGPVRSAAMPIAFGVAVLWVVHPLTTASVTYIVQRVESLMGLFYLATLYAVIRAAETDFRSRIWMALAIVACALGMGAKEAMVGAPIAAGIWIWIFRPDMPLRGRPRVLLLALAATWIILAVLAAQPHRTMSVGLTLGGWSPLLYLRTQAEVIVHYLRLVFWPVDLVFMYVTFPVWSWIDALPELLALAAALAATVFGIVKRKPAAFAGACFFLVLAPSSSLLPIVSEIAAEHRMYLPLAGVLAILVPAGYWIAARIPGRGASRWVPVAFVAAAVLALGSTTRARNRDYVTFDVMARTMIDVQPHNSGARTIVATKLARENRLDEAEAQLRAALDAPMPLGAAPASRAVTHMQLAIVAGKRGSNAEAVRHLEKAIELDPKLRDAYGLLGQARLKLGRIVEALQAFDGLLAVFPNASDWLVRSAWVRATTSDDRARDGRRAISDAMRALQVNGESALGLAALAAARAETGDFAGAAEAVRRAAELLPSDSEMRPRLQRYLELFAARQPIRVNSW